MPVGGSAQGVRSAVLAAVDRAFSEPIRILPLSKGVKATDRDPVEILAVLRVGGGEQTNIDGGRAQGWRTQLASGKAELHIATAAYPGLQVRTKDKIRAMSRPGEPMWEVLRVDDRGENRLVLELGEA